MDSAKLMDKDFVKMDMSPELDYQNWSFMVYLLLCEKKMEYCVNLPEPIIIDEFTQE